MGKAKKKFDKVKNRSAITAAAEKMRAAINYEKLIFFFKFFWYSIWRFSSFSRLKGHWIFLGLAGDYWISLSDKIVMKIFLWHVFVKDTGFNYFRNNFVINAYLYNYNILSYSCMCTQISAGLQFNYFVCFRDVSRHNVETYRLPENSLRWFPKPRLELKEEKQTNEKRIFVHKQFSSANHFNVILELNILLFCTETTEGLVSIPISFRDVNLEQSSSKAHPKLGVMALSHFYFWFRFLIMTLFIVYCFAEQLLSKNTFSRMRKEWK